MNAFKAFVVNVATDMIVDILSDMATKQGVTDFRDKVIALGETITNKTENEFDDECWRWVAEHVLTPEGWSAYGYEVVSWAKEYVVDSRTKYDDYTLPILIALESAFSE